MLWSFINLFSLFFISFSFLEIEAIEACKWLRAAGFPQYAQMYEGKLAWLNKKNTIKCMDIGCLFLDDKFPCKTLSMIKFDLISEMQVSNSLINHIGKLSLECVDFFHFFHPHYVERYKFFIHWINSFRNNYWDFDQCALRKVCFGKK